VLWQVFNYTRGAVVTLFPSDQIVITSANKLGRNYPGQPDLVALIAAIAYVNAGDIGHNAVVRQEYIRFSLGHRRIEHRWYEFGSFDLQDAQSHFKRESEARPFPVNAGSAVSHETLFTAWEVQCEQATKGCDAAQNFVKWDDFVKTLKSTNQLVITTGAQIYSKSPVEATCVVRLRDWEIAIIENEQWLAAACADIRTDARVQRRTGPQGISPNLPK
jgi:hypothetical protein